MTAFGVGAYRPLDDGAAAAGAPSSPAVSRPRGFPVEWSVEDREALIREVLRALEPDEDNWKHFSVLVIPGASCADAAVREYLKRSPRPFPVPIEALSYTVRYVGGEKVVVVDLRRVDGLRQAIEEAFGHGRRTRPDGFFKA